MSSILKPYPYTKGGAFKCPGFPRLPHQPATACNSASVSSSMGRISRHVVVVSAVALLVLPSSLWMFPWKRGVVQTSCHLILAQILSPKTKEDCLTGVAKLNNVIASAKTLFVNDDHCLISVVRWSHSSRHIFWNPGITNETSLHQSSWPLHVHKQQRQMLGMLMFPRNRIQLWFSSLASAAFMS